MSVVPGTSRTNDVKSDDALASQSLATTAWDIRTQIGVVVTINALLVIPAFLALCFVRESPQSGPPGHTPYGYSVALLIWCLPVVAIVVWLFGRNDLRFQRVCCWWTLGVLIPIGFVLDLLFGHAFFTYSNDRAVLGVGIPAVGGALPIEEFVFFVAAFSFVVLTYVWTDQYWLAAYQVVPSIDSLRVWRGRLRFHIGSLWVSVAVLVGAAIYKVTMSDHPQGFPWYLAYILVVAIAPPAGFAPIVARFVNWRAFLFTQLSMVLLCLIFEVTLGAPYAWWGFRSEMMTGIYIKAWSNLPIEEPLVWMASTFTCVITFEVVRLVRRFNSIQQTRKGTADGE